MQATLHWVSAADAVPAEIRLYNPLFARPDPNVAEFAADLNPNSLEVLTDCKLEPAIVSGNSDAPVQFERQGYFRRDPEFDARPSGLRPHGRPARLLGQNPRREGHLRLGTPPLVAPAAAQTKAVNASNEAGVRWSGPVIL